MSSTYTFRTLLLRGVLLGFCGVLLLSCEAFFDPNESASSFVDTRVSVISDTAVVTGGDAVGGSYTYYLDYSEASIGLGTRRFPLNIDAYELNPLTGERGDRLAWDRSASAYTGPGAGTFSLSPFTADWSGAEAIIIRGSISAPVTTDSTDDIVLIGDEPLRLFLPESVDEGGRAEIAVLQTERSRRTVTLSAQPSTVLDFEVSGLTFGEATDRIVLNLEAGSITADTTVTVIATDGTNTDTAQLLIVNYPDPVRTVPGTGEWSGLWSESGDAVAGQEVSVSVYDAGGLTVYIALSGGAFGDDEANLRGAPASDGSVSGTLRDTISGDSRGALSGTVLETEGGSLVADLDGTVDGSQITVRFTIDPVVRPAY